MKQAGSEQNTASARAVTRYIRISPRKVRLVLDAVRRKPVGEAFSILANLKKKAARIVAKTLKSAVANAKKKELDENRLFVRLAFADGGPTLKRYLPRAMGRADTILKRTSHVTVVVEEDALRRFEPNANESDKPSKMQKPLKQKAAGKKGAVAAV